MTRPFVNLAGENKLNELMNELHRNLDKFLAFGEVVGILLSGGMARGYADHLSEIDLIIFLTQDQYEMYQSTKTPIPQGIAKIDGYLYDIKIESYHEALSKKDSMVALWDLSYAKVLYDPDNKLSDLIKGKLSQPLDISQAENLLFEAWWNYNLAGDIWIHRRDIEQGHYVLNNAIKPLLSALFLANGEYIPHDKWLVHMSKTLEWKPEGWDQELADALSTGNFDLQSLVRRQQAIARLWSSIDGKLRETTGSKMSMMQKYFYETLQLLVDKGNMSFAEWKEVSSFGILNSQPFHDVVTMENERIILDVDKLLALGPHDMYSWFFEIVEAVTGR